MSVTKETTDQVIGSPNPDICRVIARGTIQVTADSEDSTNFWTGSNSVDIDFMRGTVTNPVAMAWLHATGPGIAVLETLPRIWFDANSNLANLMRNDITFRISESTFKEDGLSLQFFAYSDREATFTIYYIVTSMSIDPSASLIAL